MADDLTNLTNVEDDLPEAPVAEAAPAAAAPEAPPDPDDQDTVEVNGTRLVPLSALKAVREEVKSLKGAASQAQTLAQQVAALQGQLHGYQQVTEQLRQPAQPQAQPQADPAALKFAQRLDLYRQDANGQAVPDVEKATEILGIIGQVSEQKIRSAVQPMVTQTAQARSAANYQWAVSQKDPHGKTVDQHLITQIWQSFPPEYTANPQIAQTLVYTALGMDRMRQQPQPQAPSGPPVFTEGVGGNPRTRPAMSAIESNVAKERGVSEKQWSDLTKGYKPGHTTVLED